MGRTQAERRSQAERRAETRRRLLDAAAALFARHGVSGVSVDAIADAADRTSGAVYDHFGSKEGLLIALLDEWKDAAAAVIAAEFETAGTLDEQLLALWRNFAAPPSDPSTEWVILEHELWLYACRNPAVRELLARRYSAARDHLDGALHAGDFRDATPSDPVAALVIAFLIGLEMQRRVDPDAVTDDMAVAGLRGILQLRPAASPLG